jgi:putative ABC transport system substrate-binding protein
MGMRRRDFLGLTSGFSAGLLTQPSHSAAQSKQHRIGLLAVTAATPAMLKALHDGLRERGYVEGQNLSIDVRWPQRPGEQVSDIAAQFARNNVDLILSWTTSATVAGQHATSTIPIVFVGISDPVGAKFVSNLARPGGNLTGVSNVAADLSAKQVELLREIVPDIKRIGVIANPGNPGSVAQLPAMENAIRALGLQVTRASAGNPDEYEKAFARMTADGVQGVVLAADGSLFTYGRQVADIATAARLPTIFQRRENVEAGGLLSYGPNLVGQFRQTATYVDRIFKGAKPFELPVEQPTTFELVVNVKTAKALGLTVPPTLLARADEVIE